MSHKRWTEVLCMKCGGNGVVKIHHGVSTCPRCDGRCYEPDDEPLAASPARTGSPQDAIDWDNLHSGDDEYLDLLAGISATIEEAIADHGEMGEDVEALTDALADLERFDAHYISLRKAASVPAVGRPEACPLGAGHQTAPCTAEGWWPCSCGAEHQTGPVAAVGRDADQPEIDSATSTDDADPVTVLRMVRYCASCWVGEARLLGNVRARDIVKAIDAILTPSAFPGASPAERPENR